MNKKGFQRGLAPFLLVAALLLGGLCFWSTSGGSILLIITTLVHGVFFVAQDGLVEVRDGKGALLLGQASHHLRELVLEGTCRAGLGPHGAEEQGLGSIRILVCGLRGDQIKVNHFLRLVKSLGRGLAGLGAHAKVLSEP